MRTTCLFPALLLVVALPLAATTPPCSPCAGVRLADAPDAALLDALATPPRLVGEARLYVSWPHPLDRPAEAAVAPFAELAGAGATPWLRLVFRTPSPVTANGQRLEEELEAAAALARELPDGPRLQLVWEPARVAESTAGPPRPQEYAFLFKRAAVAVTGARPDARVITGPLPPDAATLEAFYAQEVAAYLDGVALAPAATPALATAAALLAELDPGRPVVVDGLPWPEQPWETVATAAELAAAGVALTLFDRSGEPEPLSPEELAPLELLATEFQGDLSYDPSTPPLGTAGGWTFVRGEDLGLRVVVRTPGDAEDESVVRFADPLLRSPRRIDPRTGEPADLFGLRRTPDGLELPIRDAEPVTLLRLDRMTAAELEGIEGLEERVDVTGERQMPVEEILRRLQAFEDDQRRRLDHYSAENTTHLRFQVGTGSQSLEATFQGAFFFRQGEGFDWAWQQFYVNGVRWRGKTIPEIPLIQPEKAATLPAEITFTKEYRYRLRGTETVRGRDCWVVEFEPEVAVEGGRSLFQGTVWVDREIYARVRSRAVQLGLDGEVLSNEETVEFSPVDADGAPAPWEPASFFLPLRTVGQQLWSVLSATTVVEREVLLDEVRINAAGFEERRAELLASDTTMVRDTEAGLRYLVVDEETGERVVQEEIDKNRRFVVAGVFQDESLDFPIPLGGFNWLWLDWRDTGTQANVFFAGALLNVAITDPDLFGSRFDGGFDAFALAVPGTDTIFRDGREVEAEDVEVRSPNVDFKLGRPFGNFFKLDLEYELAFVDFGRADDTADGFVLPSDHLRHSFRLRGRYNRSGYRLRVAGSYHLRSEWEPWGLPGSTEFDPDDETYVKWQAGLGKVWHLPNFRKVGLELEYFGGERLDRFSKYDFGFFSDLTVHGYQSGKVRGEEAVAAHLSYGFDLAELLRLDLVGDAAWATDDASGLDRELLAGVGLVGTVVGPWQTVINVDVGVAVDGPDDGVSAFVAVLKLFD